MEDPQPEVVPQDPSGEQSQLDEEQIQAEPTNEPTNEDQLVEEPAEAANSHDKWLRDKGIDPNDPEAMAKVATMAQNAERAMHQKAQKASELEKQLGTVDSQSESTALAKAEALERKLMTRDFFDRNPTARENEQAMVDYITSDPIKKELVAQGFLSLDDVHAIVSGSGGNTQALTDKARKETLEGLANKQRATAVNGNATTSTPAPQVTKANADVWWESLGAKGRADPENRKELDRLLS